MPEVIPLYDAPPRATIEDSKACQLDSNCKRCSLGRASDNNGVPISPAVCIPADGDAADIGELLVIADGISKHDAVARRPLTSGAGLYLRSLISKHWKTGVVYDSAVRCYAGSGDVTTDAIEACRGYLKGTLDEVRPKRVIAVGKASAFSIFGRAVQPFSAQRGWGWLENSGSPVPVFFIIPPVFAKQNRFIAKIFEEDLKWALSYNPPKPPWGLPVQVVSSLEESEKACELLRESEWVSFDVETSGRMYNEDFKVISISLANAECDLCYVWDAGGILNYFEPVKRLLQDPRVKKVGQNVKYDLAAIRDALGWWVEGIHGDTRLWRKLLDPEAEANLASMGELVGMGGHKLEADQFITDFVKNTRSAAAKVARRQEEEESSGQTFLIPNITADQDAEMRLSGGDPYALAYARVPRSILLRYNGRDSVVTSLIANTLEGQLAAEPNIQRIWDRVVGPASTAIARVERWGVPCSVDSLNTFERELTLNQALIQKRLSVYGNVNWGSTLQLRKFLYEDLGLAPQGTTDSGLPATDEQALKALKAQHPAVADILDLRFINKMKGTYAEGMLAHIRDDDRIHGSINLDGARSGRTSMTDPNLQNIPRKDSPEGKMAKDCFVAPPGHLFLQADYGQLELRIAALLSGDEEMVKVFKSGVDYHLRTAQLISFVWGKKPEEITRDSAERTGAKAFNFGIMYGMSDSSIAKNANCSVAQASAIRQAIFGTFKKLAKWIQEQLAYARRTGVAWTVWEGCKARRRPLYRIADMSEAGSRGRSTAENSSYNTPVQGTASEFCIASLVRCVNLIENDGLPAELVLPVHDSLLFVVPEKKVLSVAAEVQGAMTDYNWLCGVPLEVDLEVGKSWGSLSKIKV